MAFTAALKAAHATVDDAVASHAAAETLVNHLRNTIAQLPLATRSSDAQLTTTADRAALDENLDLAQRAASATKTQLDSARALLSMLIDASTDKEPAQARNAETDELFDARVEAKVNAALAHIL
jgi:hypothetical protein